MQPYFDINGNSNVLCYDIGTNYIDVQFRGTPKVYRYSYSSAGANNVETMKSLARQVHGLNSYINKNVRYLYEK